MSGATLILLVTFSAATAGLIVGWIIRGDEQQAQRAADDRARSHEAAAPVADTWTWPLATAVPDTAASLDRLRQDDAA